MNPEIGERAAGLRRDRVPFVHARVVRAQRPTSAKPGDEAVVLPDGSIEGFVGGVCAESTVRAQSLSLLDSGDSLLLRISPEGDDGVRSDESEDADDGALTVVNPCLSGGTLEIFLEPAIPAPALVVQGESPIASALVALAAGVGFRVVGGAGALADAGGGGVAAVVVASHGRDEEKVLEEAARAGVPYVGLVASRKRGESVVAGLDLDDAQKAAVHTPAGLDIGARTPREVALLILAEIVSMRPRPSAMASAPSAVTTEQQPVASSAEGPSTGRSSDDPSSGQAAVPAGDGDTSQPVAFGRPVVRPDVATDLVCGMSVVADEAALHLDHDGIRYWFCGSGCLRAFAADPGAYVSGTAG